MQVRSATTSNWVCAHVCVRTLIWACEVRACDPKKGRNSHLVKIMSHFLENYSIMKSIKMECERRSEALHPPFAGKMTFYNDLLVFIIYTLTFDRNHQLISCIDKTSYKNCEPEQSFQNWVLGIHNVAGSMNWCFIAKFL